VADSANGVLHSVIVRPLRSGTGTSHEGPTLLGAFRTALGVTPDQESVVVWRGTRELCAVDFDASKGYEFDDAKLMVLLDTFQPRPAVAWVTKSGGLRMVYEAQGEFTADEVGAVALLNLSDARPSEGLELKHETRHPSAPDSNCGVVVHREQEFDLRSLRRRLSVFDASDAEVAEWLATRGMEVGGRYDHESCPVTPSARGSRQPVIVLEAGVHCFVCEAAGVCAGSSRAGFFPYTHLCGVRRSTMLYRCLESATHWEHARFVVDELLDMSPQHSRLAYSAGVAMFRGREVADRCFAVGRDFIRIGDRWTNLCGETYVRDVRPLLASLPACTFADERTGAIKVDRGRVTTFEQSFDLTQYGYPSLVPVFGVRMWPLGSDDGQVRAVVQTRELAGDDSVDLRPRYLPPQDRVDPWPIFEECFPQLHRNLLKLLVAARGVVEGAQSMPPLVFVTGPTGASKSLTVFLAAAVLGDKNTEVVWTANTDRMRQAIIDGATTGTYVTFNEVLKEAQRHVKSQTQAMDYVLNLTPDSVSHYMYIGPMRMGRLPVFVWTDTEIPDVLKKDAQLARRMVHVKLSSKVDWEEPLKRTGVGHPKRFRVSDERRARACDSLLSQIVDEFFRPPRSFEEVAVALGFRRMIDSVEAEEGRDSLRTLFAAVCAAPPLDGADAVRWKGRGWKMLSREHETPLRDAWASVADEQDFHQSRRVAAEDWQKLLDLKEAAQVELRVHGNKMAVRFRSVEGTRVDHRVNEELR
jgi:hypothetical protein